jgi:hypothetical protein
MHEVKQSCPFWAQGAAVDGVVRVALDVEDVAVTFFALSPRLYMMMPQPTEQYEQVLRASVARANLKSRVSAKASIGEKPSATRLDAANPVPLTWKNCLRFYIFRTFLRRSGRPRGIERKNAS